MTNVEQNKADKKVKKPSFYFVIFCVSMGFAIIFSVLTIISALVADIYSFVSNILISSLFIEIAYYRYLLWKPERSKQFAIGAQTVLDVVHKEGVLKYVCDGNTYALYSNKATDDNKETTQ
jgi:hypothetical protein